jgi:hypothetical protein
LKPQPHIAVRSLLKEGAKRFRSLSKRPAIARPRGSLEEAFNVELNNVRAKPSLQRYNQDCLLWLAEELIEGFNGVRVARPQHKYFSAQWEWSTRSVYFAFEAGHHNARWRAIANEAIKLASNSNGAVRTVVFRTPDLKTVPGPNWAAARQVLDEARRRGLMIVLLTVEEVCELHAGREFYSNALQGKPGVYTFGCPRIFEAALYPVVRALLGN